MWKADTDEIFTAEQRMPILCAVRCLRSDPAFRRSISPFDLQLGHLRPFPYGLGNVRLEGDRNRPRYLFLRSFAECGFQRHGLLYDLTDRHIGFCTRAANGGGVGLQHRSEGCTIRAHLLSNNDTGDESLGILIGGSSRRS